MQGIDYSAIRLIQSVKSISSYKNQETLADRLYLDALCRAFSQETDDASTFVADIVGRTLSAARIGEISEIDHAFLSEEDRQLYSSGLSLLVPESCKKVFPKDDIGLLPRLQTEGAPSIAVQMCGKYRAGYEGPDGQREQGSPKETQAGHALTTCVIAALLGNVDAALIGLFHNLHMAMFPDTPHLVERAMGAEVLRSLEERAQKRILRKLPKTFISSSLYNKTKRAMRDQKALDVFNLADFLDRTLWLINISPRWLDVSNYETMRTILCNFDYRLKAQERILKEIQTQLTENKGKETK